jgi:transglutaminase-like putative cysteine protease
MKHERQVSERDALLGAVAVLVVVVLLGFTMRRWFDLVPTLLALCVLPFAPAVTRRSYGVIGYALLGAPILLLHQMQPAPLTAIGRAQFHGTYFSALFATNAAVLCLYAPALARQRVVGALLWASTALCFTGVGYPSWLYRTPEWRTLTGLADNAPHPHTLLLTGAAILGLLFVIALRRELGHQAGGSAGGAARLSAVALCFLLCLGLGGGLSLGIKASYQDISRLVFELTRGIPLRATGGFSDSADLGSVMSDKGRDGGRTIALRAFGKEPPGYLRGKTFAHYVGTGWKAIEKKATVTASEGRLTFPERNSAPEDADADWRIVTSDRYNAIFFTPLDCGTVETPAERHFLYAGNVIRSLDEPTTGGYRVHRDRRPLHREGQDPVYVELPEDPALLSALDEHIAAAKVSADLPLPRLLRRLADHFERRYEYKFGIRFRPDGPSPLVQFLTEKSHGHCELFASSGALMLRKLGLATRYVTGLVCDEKNPYDEELWIARNGAAHAWVEVYDPRQGWVIAEFTPGSGLPQATPASSFEAFLDWVRGKWERLKSIPWNELPTRAALAVRDLLTWVFSAWWRIALLFAGVGAFFYREWRKRKGAAVAAMPERAFSPEVADLRQAFFSLEGRLAAEGLTRGAGETLLAFAARLRASENADAADLTERLAAVRYAPGA